MLLKERNVSKKTVCVVNFVILLRLLMFYIGESALEKSKINIKKKFKKNLKTYKK